MLLVSRLILLDSFVSNAFLGFGAYLVSICNLGLLIIYGDWILTDVYSFSSSE